jgi:hypothetical protein
MEVISDEATIGGLGDVASMMDDELPNWDEWLETETNQTSRKRAWSVLDEDLSQDLCQDTMLPEASDVGFLPEAPSQASDGADAQDEPEQGVNCLLGSVSARKSRHCLKLIQFTRFCK